MRGQSSAYVGDALLVPHLNLVPSGLFQEDGLNEGLCSTTMSLFATSLPLGSLYSGNVCLHTFPRSFVPVVSKHGLRRIAGPAVTKPHVLTHDYGGHTGGATCVYSQCKT
jgi:hypothetical protein